MPNKDPQRLKDLPNISKVIESELILAGIHTPDQLKKIGSKEAFNRIRMHDPGACQNMLCALEGAIQDIRWFNLPEETKAHLKSHYRTLL